MIFHFVTLFPHLIKDYFSEGVIAKAIKNNIVNLNFYNPRDFTNDKYRTVDDRPFGGGDGMVLMAEPLQNCLESIFTKKTAVKIENIRKIYLSPQGKTLNEGLVQDLAIEKEIILVCGRYGGIDQRFLNYNSFEEISIGDYVLTGGELAANVLVDVVCRKIKGVLGHQESAMNDSFVNGLLECPQFTRPQEWRGLSVPEILLSGNHKNIERYRLEIAKLITYLKKPNLLNEERQNLKLEFNTLISTLTNNEKEALGLMLLDIDKISL